MQSIKRYTIVQCGGSGFKLDINSKTILANYNKSSNLYLYYLQHYFFIAFF